MISIIESILFKATAFSDILKGLTVSEALTASLEGVIVCAFSYITAVLI